MRMFRYLLFPFAIVYNAVTAIRNFLFDKGLMTSKVYEFPVLAVGNLSVGGTGKTPMIEYLINLLQKEYTVATLSRGYGRKTKGFLLADSSSSAIKIGDEPLQFYSKFKEIHVAVDENRQRGIAKLEQLVKPDVVLLDDAFQHRKVTAGLYVLLTKYDALFSEDFLLPTGNLRESKHGANRANIVVVTKCPKNLSINKQSRIKNKLKLKTHQQLFFTTIGYADFVVNSREKKKISDLKHTQFTLVTGIANPAPLVAYLNEKGLEFEHLSFPDHHNFSKKELSILEKKESILTTEKDYMRLKNVLSNISYLPIETVFLSESTAFDKAVLTFAKSK